MQLKVSRLIPKAAMAVTMLPPTGPMARSTAPMAVKHSPLAAGVPTATTAKPKAETATTVAVLRQAALDWAVLVLVWPSAATATTAHRPVMGPKAQAATVPQVVTEPKAAQVVTAQPQPQPQLTPQAQVLAR